MTLCAACNIHPVAHRALCVHCFFRLHPTAQAQYSRREIGTIRAIELLRLRQASYRTITHRR